MIVELEFGLALHMHCSRVLNCSLTSYSPQRASCLSQQMLHEQLVGILLLHPSEHDATPWFLQPGLKGRAAHITVHFLRDQNASQLINQLLFTDMPHSTGTATASIATQ